MRHAHGTMLRRAKAMRSESTGPEALLWCHLRAGRPNGRKFRRQLPIGSYVADVVCKSHALIVEIDGDTHAGNEERDARRTAWLELQGYRVIRSSNADVTTNEATVLESVVAALARVPLPRVASLACPLPASGEREEK